MARLADADAEIGLIAVHGERGGADIAAVEQVVVFVAQRAAQPVFGIEAQAGFDFLARQFGDGDFHGHAVALPFVKSSLHRCAGIMAVVFQGLLVIQQFVQIVHVARFELRQTFDDGNGVTPVAFDLEIAEVNRLLAVDLHRQIGAVRLRIDGGLGLGEGGQRVFAAGHGAQGRRFAGRPVFLAEGSAHGQLPRTQGVFIVSAQFAVFQDVAQNGHIDLVDAGAFAGGHFHQPACTLAAHGDLCVEIAFGFEQVLRFFGCVFGKEVDLFVVQLFPALVVDNRQVFLQQFLQLFIIDLDGDGVFGFERFV